MEILHCLVLAWGYVLVLERFLVTSFELSFLGSISFCWGQHALVGMSMEIGSVRAVEELVLGFGR